MILAVDVHYKETYAKTVAVLFEDWISDEPSDILEVSVNKVSEYVPGEFYKRELPCIMEILKSVDLTNIDCIIIDGYVYVDNQEQWGLGAYLYQALGQQIPVVGIAKTSFQNNKDTVTKVYRGESRNPLYVSAVGMDKDVAAHKVAQMFGPHRIPYLLKLMDQKTKES